MQHYNALVYDSMISDGRMQRQSQASERAIGDVHKQMQQMPFYT